MAHVIKLNFHHDAGHGWLEVPLAMVRDVRETFTPSQFSYYSPRKGMVYLEEDCDAPRFEEAYKKKNNIFFDVNSIYDGNESPIRKLGRC